MDDIVDLIPFIKAYVLPATSSSLSTSSTDSEAATASPGTRRSPRNSAIGDKQDAVSDDLSESQALCNHLKIGQMLRGNGGHGNKKSSTFGGVILKRPRGRPRRAQSQNRKFGVKEMKRWLQKHYQRHPDSYQSVAKIMLEANREVKVKVTSKKVIQGVKAVFPELKTKECDGNVYGFNGIISKKLLPRPRKNENLNPPPLLKRQPPKKQL
ncbi:uncharacterized protein LOC106169074 [Lingula anatina]|uniref:Uncharacterized protein LOC106169074 n=1 Tax=Lingula anatina TaxID=7574 RepID=A0A1S3J061_LINAN|nr:uncharacterized protein LOC106169074 [Lingula anatina]|eukprot:XP_013403835.1 uncharacterized protein LOC106169074 [Lingula anatina]